MSDWESDDELPLVDCFSDDSDDNDGSASEAEEWDDEDDLPLVVRPVTKWSRHLHAPDLKSYDMRSGPTTKILKKYTELDFFKLMFPISLFTHIVEETNRFAAQAVPSDPTWRDCTESDIMQFLGMIMAMGILVLPEYNMYWRSDWLFGVPGFGKIMTRNRFNLLLRFFHLNDTTKAKKKGEAGYDSLFLIRPVMDTISEIFLNGYTPHREQSIDEAMVGFRGRLGFKQYMPAKPTKFGIKVWVRADAHNGYVCQFQVYTGRALNAEGKPSPEANLASRVVKDLVKSITEKNSEMFMDNFFSSPKLFNDMLECGTYATGTCRMNRKDWPQSLQKGTVKKPGESKTLQKGQLTATTWFDKRQVCFLSTSADPTNISKVQRKQKSGQVGEVEAPSVVSSYGSFMGGVDRADRLRVEYPSTRKAKKWWKYMFFYMFDTAVCNAFLLMRESTDHSIKTNKGKSRDRTQLEFRMALSKLLIGEHRVGQKRTLSSANDTTSGGGHWPTKREKKQRCRQCLSNGMRHESCIFCKRCDVALCVDCFEAYHVSLPDPVHVTES